MEKAETENNVDIDSVLDNMIKNGPKKKSNFTSILNDKKPKIQELFRCGWSIKDIYTELLEKKVIDITYSGFLKITSSWKKEVSRLNHTAESKNDNKISKDDCKIKNNQELKNNEASKIKDSKIENFKERSTSNYNSLNMDDLK